MIIDRNKNKKDNSIHIGVTETRTLHAPFHYHLEHYELTFVEEGSGILMAGNRITEFQGNDIILIPPKIPHAWRSFKNKELNHLSHFRYITVHFTLNYLTEGLLLRPEMINIRRLLVAAEQVAILEKIENKTIIDLLFNLKLESDFTSYIQILELLNLLGSSRVLKQFLPKGYSYRGNKKDLAHFEKVFEYILDNYTQRIKISIPAGILSLNDTAFSHYFKKRTGQSFTDFINQLRLMEADALVKYSHKKIARICTECGFNNLSNFNRIYKSWKNMSPAESRKLYNSVPQPA